jgi:hypothetical protein
LRLPGFQILELPRPMHNPLDANLNLCHSVEKQVASVDCSANTVPQVFTQWMCLRKLTGLEAELTQLAYELQGTSRIVGSNGFSNLFEVLFGSWGEDDFHHCSAST